MWAFLIHNFGCGSRVRIIIDYIVNRMTPEEANLWGLSYVVTFVIEMMIIDVIMI